MYQPMNQAGLRSLYGSVTTTDSRSGGIIIIIIRAIISVIIAIGRIFFPLVFNNFISNKIFEMLGF